MASSKSKKIKSSLFFSPLPRLLQKIKIEKRGGGEYIYIYTVCVCIYIYISHGRSGSGFRQDEGLLFLGFANPAPVAHFLQAPKELLLGTLVVGGRLFGLRVDGELLEIFPSHLGAKQLEKLEEILLGDARNIQFGPEEEGGGFSYPKPFKKGNNNNNRIKQNSIKN